jgi:hypothetical protein
VNYRLMGFDLGLHGTTAAGGYGDWMDGAAPLGK